MGRGVDLVEIEGNLNAATLMLKEMEHRTADLTGVWDRVGQHYADRQRRLFTSGVRRQWAPLKPQTVLRKRREGFAGRGVLVRTGALMAAATNPKPLTVSKRYAVFGIRGYDGRVAKWHRKGTSSMPARNPVPALDKIARERITREIVAYIEEAGHVS